MTNEHARGFHPWALATLVAIVLGSASFNWIYHVRVLDHIEFDKDRKEQREMSLTSTWTSGGVQHSLTTTKGETETAAEHATRHRIALAAAMIEFPNDAPPPGGGD